jgi:hypothetical protein
MVHLALILQVTGECFYDCNEWQADDRYCAEWQNITAGSGKWWAW